MRYLSLLLRLLVEFVLLPIRLLGALFGGLLVAGGVIGTPAWLIQTVIGNGGSGSLPAWAMCLLSLAAIPVGLTLISLVTTSTLREPERSEDHDHEDATGARVAASHKQPGAPRPQQPVRQTDGIRLAYASRVEHQRRSRRATNAVATAARPSRHREAH